MNREVHPELNQQILPPRCIRAPRRPLAIAGAGLQPDDKTANNPDLKTLTLKPLTLNP